MLEINEEPVRAGFTANGAALSSYQLIGRGGQPAMDLTRLVATEVHRPVATREAAPQLTYEVQWQASVRATDFADAEGRPARRRPVEWLVTSGKTQCALFGRARAKLPCLPSNHCALRESLYDAVSICRVCCSHCMLLPNCSLAIFCCNMLTCWAVPRSMCLPADAEACERGIQLLRHAASELQPGSTITLRTRGVQLTGAAIDVHRPLGSPSARAAAAASWGLLRVAASEITVNLRHAPCY